MLKRIRIENYRSIGEVDIELGPLTVLVGQNGSGKTNFVDAIHFLCDALTYGLDAALARRGEIGGIRRWARGRPRDVSFGINLATAPPEGLDATYALTLHGQAGGDCIVRTEALDAWACDGAFRFEARDGSVVDSSWGEAMGDIGGRRGLLAPLWGDIEPFVFTGRMRDMGFYSIFPDALRALQEPGPDHPLDEHGANLASVLRATARDAPAAMSHIKAALSALSPDIRDMQVKQFGGHLLVRFLHEEADGKRHWLDSKQMSDGTLRMLGILTALYQEPALSLVAIEEPELTIHPGMLAVLRDVIVEASQKRSQVIITTHSPDLMNLFDVDVLRVVEMTAEGTKIGPVAQHQREAVRENLFLPGELARMEGLARAQ